MAYTSPIQQAADQLKQQLGGTGLPSAPPQPGLLQKAGNFVGGVAKAIVSPFARAGVESFNTTKGLLEELQNPNTIQNIKQGHFRAPIAGSEQAQSEFDQPRNLPLLGQTKPTLTNSEHPGLNQALDVAGQGVQLGLDATGAEGLSVGSGVTGALATGGIYGAGQGFGNALTQTEGKSFGQNVGNIAGQTAIGGLTGAATGGVLKVGSDLYTGHPIFQSSNPLTSGAAQDQVATANQNYANADINAAKTTNAANKALQGDVGKGGALGKEYAAKIANIPGESNLSNSEVESLQNVKEGKNYQTPDFVEKASGTQAIVGDRTLNPENPAVKAQIEKLTGQSADQTGLKVSSKQAGEIMRGLNESTYKIADGQKVIDQSRIGITKQLEAKFAKDFGPDWVAAHSEFKAGVKFRDTLDGIVNFDKNATPDDLIKQTDTLQKQLSTPGGEYQIQKVIDEYASVRGEDKASVLEDLIAKTKEVGKTQEILKTAQTNLKEAVALAEKGGFSKQFISGLKDPRLLARRAVYVAASIPTGIVLLPYLRALYKSWTK